MPEEMRVPHAVGRDEMNGLMTRYIDDSNRGVIEAKVLRGRIAKGLEIERAQGPHALGSDGVTVATKLATLKAELRLAEFRSMVGLGLAMGHATAVTINEAVKDNASLIPPGALVRVYIPGVCDIAVKVDGYGGE